MRTCHTRRCVFVYTHLYVCLTEAVFPGSCYKVLGTVSVMSAWVRCHLTCTLTEVEMEVLKSYLANCTPRFNWHVSVPCEPHADLLARMDRLVFERGQGSPTFSSSSQMSNGVRASRRSAGTSPESGLDEHVAVATVLKRVRGRGRRARGWRSGIGAGGRLLPRPLSLACTRGCLFTASSRGLPSGAPKPLPSLRVSSSPLPIRTPVILHRGPP